MRGLGGRNGREAKRWPRHVSPQTAPRRKGSRRRIIVDLEPKTPDLPGLPMSIADASIKIRPWMLKAYRNDLRRKEPFVAR
jgi:hypothetical protein